MVERLESLAANDENYSDNQLHFGVGDPATALRRNAGKDSEGAFLLLHTFVTRIALWGVLRLNGYVSDDYKIRKTRARSLWQRSFETQVDLFFPKGHYSPLRLGYCESGETTSSVVTTFAASGFHPFVNFNEKPHSLGIEEIRGVVTGAYDVTLTYAPWLLDIVVRQEDEKREDYEVAPIFQGVSYPFSGVFLYIPTKQGNAVPFLSLAKRFNQQLMTALTLLSRYRRTSSQLLVSLAAQMRHYGLDPSIENDVRDDTIRKAFRELIFSNCYSDSFDIPHFSWDLRATDDEECEALSLEASKSFHMLKPYDGDIVDMTTRMKLTLKSIVEEVMVESFAAPPL